jgi:DNA replication protein DnaC
MNGKTGLGKTHLSLAIANEVIKRGFGVIYVSAPIVVSKLEKEQFSRNKENIHLEDTLTECDLLIIDDLGTEFINKFSSQAVYNLFNSRLLLGKPTIVSTNLTLDKIQEIYSERFVSRIVGEAHRLDFFGSDVRLMKK